MLGRKAPDKPAAPAPQAPDNGQASPSLTLLTIVGDHAKIEGTFDIADSIQIECEVGGELNVGGKLVIGEKGVVNANVQTVDGSLPDDEGATRRDATGPGVAAGLRGLARAMRAC